jgi:hypothetical protein
VDKSTAVQKRGHERPSAYRCFEVWDYCYKICVHCVANFPNYNISIVFRGIQPIENSIYVHCKTKHDIWKLQNQLPGSFFTSGSPCCSQIGFVIGSLRSGTWFTVAEVWFQESSWELSGVLGCWWFISIWSIGPCMFSIWLCWSSIWLHWVNTSSCNLSIRCLCWEREFQARRLMWNWLLQYEFSAFGTLQNLSLGHVGLGLRKNPTISWPLAHYVPSSYCPWC